MQHLSRKVERGNSNLLSLFSVQAEGAGAEGEGGEGRTEDEVWKGRRRGGRGEGRPEEREAQGARQAEEH